MRGMVVLTVLSLILFISFPLTLADEGIIAIPPKLNVSVYEPGQKAIIAWNGTEEILILSVDVSASEDTLALRILPLPSNPKAIEKANFTSFIAIQEILRKHAPFVFSINSTVELLPEAEAMLDNVVITFHEKIGVHDITVVKANNSEELTYWISEFLVENGIVEEISLQEFRDVIEDYISRGFFYFVLDLVNISSHEKSVEPILYRFETNFLYYPLRISSIISGNTSITLFLLTQDRIGGYIYPFKVGAYDRILIPTNWFNYTSTAVEFYGASLGEERLWVGVPPEFNLTAEELEQIDPRIKYFLGDTAMMSVLWYKGPIGLFVGDLILAYNETIIGYPFIPLPPVVVHSNQTMEGANAIPIDYQPPIIESVRYSLLIDENMKAMIQCRVEDELSGVQKVILFYRYVDGGWGSIDMENVEGNYTATIPLSIFKNINFYVKALDRAGNKAVDDNNKLYYYIDTASYLYAIILHNVGTTLICIVAAASVAFVTNIYLKKKLYSNSD